jgi:nitrogen fixation NifU-like protein
VLDALYQDGIIDLARKSRTRDRLDAPDASARADNPLCGDRVTVDLAISDGKIAGIGHKVRGCALCEAAAEVIAEAANGLQAADLKAVEVATRAYLTGTENDPPWARLSVFQPVRAIKSRHDCVLLPFSAINRAFADLEGADLEGADLEANASAN